MTRAAVAGIGQTPYAKNMGRTESDLAVGAIRAACADAGLPVSAIDGFVSYHVEQVAEVELLTTLGIPELRFMARTPSGGGGAASLLGLAAVAVVERDRRVRDRLPCAQPFEGRVVRRRPQPGWPALGQGRRALARLSASGSTRSVSPRPRRRWR